MSLCLPNLLLLSFPLLLLFHSSLAATTSTTAVLTNHGGPILTGNLNLTFIWYGNFGRSAKNVIGGFVKSLTSNGESSLQPHVSEWWTIVEGFQEAAGKGKGPIRVQVGKQFTDAKCSAGKDVTTDIVKDLLKKYGAGDANAIPVIFTGRDVKVQGLCTGNCSFHGVFENKPYLIVRNPEKECLGQCGWPFSKTDIGPIGVQMNPPNGNVGTDSMVIAFAQGLVNLVTNPFSSAFFQSNDTHTIEPASACPRIFGTGSLPGYTGKIRIDPGTGGAFNAHGTNGTKFLLPAIWDPKTKSCWSLM
ncbi:protein EXORDIUM-like 6 [Euphorbia lathyris]|uniref:protein EXORDIUM-like 6 n=1 Tax=Euphorbia lathyris TaxID=212925 RepID=UPI003314063A